MTVIDHRRSVRAADRTDAAVHGDGERGVTMILAALFLVGLLVMAAVVIDIGAVYGERRQDQSAADSSALAAAQELKTSAVAVQTAKDYAATNLGVTLSAAEWNSCTSDAGALAVRAPGANCISFNSARSRVRVRVPDRYYQTGFGAVVGVDQIRHSAFAVAGITRKGFGGVLPFGMPAGAGSSDGYACLKATSGGRSEAPCDGPDSGNFGTLDFGLFGNEDVGTTKDCGSGGTRDRIANNIAVGSDHDLSLYTGGATVVDAPDACSAQTPGPNAAKTQTGQNAGPVGSGMLAGTTFSDDGPARLQRSDDNLFAGAGKTRVVHGSRVDDNPLWQFIPGTLTSGGPGGDIPQSCQRNQFADASGNLTTANLPEDIRQHISSLSPQDRVVALFSRCFTHYAGRAWDGATQGLKSLNPAEPRSGCGLGTVACTSPVFSRNSSNADSPDLYDIQYTPRFAYVPELTGTFPSGQSQAVTFKKFRSVFIQRLNLKHGSQFDPGVGTVAATGSGDVEEITIWVFAQGMLPGNLQAADAPSAIGVNRFVQLVR